MLLNLCFAVQVRQKGDFMSVTNQKVIYIHKKHYTSNFLQIGIDEMRMAQQQMTYCEFVLYLYLAGNANGFKDQP